MITMHVFSFVFPTHRDGQKYSSNDTPDDCESDIINCVYVYSCFVLFLAFNL